MENKVKKFCEAKLFRMVYKPKIYNLYTMKKSLSLSHELKEDF